MLRFFCGCGLRSYECGPRPMVTYLSPVTELCVFTDLLPCPAALSYSLTVPSVSYRYRGFCSVRQYNDGVVVHCASPVAAVCAYIGVARAHDMVLWLRCAEGTLYSP